MKLEIVKYGHPILRQKGKRVRRIDDDLRQLVDDMLETMYEANGVGLAAQQVDRALQLTVIDITGAEERPSRMWVEGREVDTADHMPLVLINPIVELSGEREAGSEGCLSFPDLTADILRPSRVRVTATDIEGGKFTFEADGLLGRAVQHEFDHLQGILFIDRMSSATKAALKGKIKRIREPIS